MNIYQVLNKITLYIENHIEEKIDYQILAKMMGVNSYTMQRLFSIIAGIPLAEYIRKRKLSVSVTDLLSGAKVIDVAIKYNYESSTTFSRAFALFHGIKPSKINKNTKLSNFPHIVFDETIKIQEPIDYEIIELDELTLYGVGIDVNSQNIKKLAPKYIREMEEKHMSVLGYVNYALTTYDDKYHSNCQKYYVLYEKKFEGFERIKVPKSKWLKFTVDSKDVKDIQGIIEKFYCEFLPSSTFNLSDMPELEHYVGNKTEFLVAISN